MGAAYPPGPEDAQEPKGEALLTGSGFRLVGGLCGGDRLRGQLLLGLGRSGQAGLAEERDWPVGPRGLFCSYVARGRVGCEGLAGRGELAATGGWRRGWAGTQGKCVVRNCLWVGRVRDCARSPGAFGRNRGQRSCERICIRGSLHWPVWYRRQKGWPLWVRNFPP